LFDVEILVLEKVKTARSSLRGGETQGGGTEMLEYDTNLRSALAAERTARLAASMTEARERASLRRRLGALLVRVGARLDSGEPEPVTPAPLELRLPAPGAGGQGVAPSGSRRAA
jgi:hypothetical protein